MSEISIDRVNMTERMNTVVARVDDLDTTLGDRPSAPDGGIASALVGFIATAGVEATGIFADATRALAAITGDVMADFELTDAEIGEAIGDLTSELEE